MTSVEQQAASASRPFAVQFPGHALAELRRRLQVPRWQAIPSFARPSARSGAPHVVHPTEGEFVMASISERESREIETANASGNTPVVLIHGLWLLPSSWANWVDFFEHAGYAPLTPDWPGDPETIEAARAEPEVLAKKTLEQVAAHTTEIIKALDEKPVVMGHSTGGLLAQMLAGRGLSAATVAIDPGIFRGVLPLPVSTLRVAGPFLVNPRTRGRAITLTFDQFRYGWANALDEKEAKELYDRFHVAGSGISLVQMGNANLNPRTEAKVDTKNPARGPLLIIEGEKDHTVPWAVAKAAYKRQRRNPAVTEIVKMPNRGHSLTIDHGWREVAQTALDFVRRFTSSGHATTPFVPTSRDASDLASGESAAETGRGSAG